MHLETHRWIAVFGFLKLVDKLGHIQRIANPARKKSEVSSHEELVFLIRRQEKPAKMIAIFFCILGPFMVGIELGPVSRS